MCIFFICIAQLINATGSTVMEFNKERTVFMREIASSLYNVYPYYFSKQIIEFPLLVWLPL
jgi:hypothetical protein